MLGCSGRPVCAAGGHWASGWPGQEARRDSGWRRGFPHRVLIRGACDCPWQVSGTWVWILVAATSVSFPLLQGWVMYVSLSSCLLSLLLLLSYVFSLHRNRENWKVLVRRGWGTDRRWRRQRGLKTPVAGAGLASRLPARCKQPALAPPCALTGNAEGAAWAQGRGRHGMRAWSQPAWALAVPCEHSLLQRKDLVLGVNQRRTAPGSGRHCCLVLQDSLYHGATAILYMSAAVLQANATIHSELTSTLYYQLNCAASVSRAP